MKSFLLAALCAVCFVDPAVAEPVAVHAIMCDEASHVDQFAEAMIGAGLAIDDAMMAVNKAASARSCVFVPVLVDDIHDEKDITRLDATYVIRRVSVIALMRASRIGLISQRIEPRVQYSLAVKGTWPNRTTLRPRRRM